MWPAPTQALANFGYRLVSKDKPGWHYTFYDLYKNDVLVKSDLSTVWRISVNGTGDDFALLVEELNGPTFLICQEKIEELDQGRHCYSPPVFVGDDLVAVDTGEQHERYAVQRGNETVYEFTELIGPGPRVDNPVTRALVMDGEVDPGGGRPGNSEWRESGAGTRIQ